MTHDEISALSNADLLAEFENQCFNRRIDYRMRAVILERMGPNAPATECRCANDYTDGTAYCQECHLPRNIPRARGHFEYGNNWIPE